MTLEEIREKLDNGPQADWVREMKEYYARTGTYRARDLRRLLGDPKMGVKIGPKGSMPECFYKHDPGESGI